ncbi:unnamed protein product [Clonostachys rosea]|uniref:Nephrocystin 3-like N-terminal domain-containing protein n=1 Tax=Bionectria ochroleuca TaxID=29856 RepID=A0ABY6V0V5_BIOOC|nr:unnamed protein product [Clonostachys rosea]
MPATHHKVDVIAISGLGGHAFGSFKERDSEYMWLRDSLPNDIVDDDDGLPVARILIYGYESTIPNSDNLQGIEDLALIFRRRLVSLVNTPTAKPMILVAHSLGGLIVKQTLLLISKSPTVEDHKLSEAIRGLVFFGVPQAGMDVEALLPIANDGPNSSLIESINSGSKALENQRQEFHEYLETRDLEIFCFYETLLSPTPVQNENGKWTMDGKKKYLVTKRSAIDCHRGRETSTHACPIPSTHSGMVKFSPHDHNYDVVRERLVPLARKAAMHKAILEMTELQTTSLAPNEARLSTDEQQSLIELLEFDQIDTRIRSVKTPVGLTCHWILQTVQYKSWRDATMLVQHHGFWWIRGKPGAGKSVMMKYLFENSKATIIGAKVISFFFNARGSILERTTLGLYPGIIRTSL